MIRIICDRCKSEVEHANKLYLAFRVFGPTSQVPGAIEVAPSFDYCDECEEWLCQTVRTKTKP